MLVLLAALALPALTAWLVWRATSRPWHLLPILGLTLLILPVLATNLTGDMSRYLPRAMFADDAAGKDQVVLASAAASICVAAVLAAGLWALALMVFHRCRGQ